VGKRDVPVVAGNQRHEKELDYVEEDPYRDECSYGDLERLMLAHYSVQ
jgi:hypothetical protein